MDEIETALSRQLDIEHLRCLLDTKIFGIGDRLVYLPIVDSTNTQAMKLARMGSEEGVVVLADSQTAGKGRQGHRWLDVAGQNVLTSTVLQPSFPPYLLVMLASLAVVDAIATSCSVTATIKWPNDVLIKERKVAGILIETSHDVAGRFVAILGIGVNINGRSAQLAEIRSEPLPGLALTAITLAEVCGHSVNREAFLAHLFRHIERNYLALQQEAEASTTETHRPTSRLIREKWRSQLSTLGRTVQVRQGNKLLSGVAEDVNEQGELLLRIHSGESISITWGEVG